EKPNIMAMILIVAIAVMRIQRVAIKLNILFRIARPQPRLLHRAIRLHAASRTLHVLGPVVPVVRDGADYLIFWNSLHGGRKILREPVLRCDGPRARSGK